MQVTEAEIARTQLEAGDLLFVEGHANPEEIGRVAVWDGSIPKCLHQNHLIRFRVDASLLAPDFAARWFNSPSGAKHFTKAGKTTSGLNTISASTVRGAPALLPPLDEQRRIAAILGRADALRVGRRNVFLLLDELTRAVFDEACRERGARHRRLGDVAEVLTGFAFKSSEYTTVSTQALKLCRGANVLPGRLDWSDLALWPQSREQEFARFRLHDGDIVVAMDRPWISGGFKIARYSRADGPALLVQRVARIRGIDDVPNEWLHAALDSREFERHCRPTETTVPHISPLELKSFPVVIPASSALTRFIALSRKIAAVRRKLQDSVAEADRLFASLESRAFSGQL